MPETCAHPTAAADSSRQRAESPLIFDITPGSFVDGPGIRTVVFLKGCPLRCRWCHNPEGQEGGVEWWHYPENCVRCGHCAAGCPAGTRREVGRPLPAAELAEILRLDAVFFRASGGGVTFSGGEPLLYRAYVRETAAALRAAGISVAVETCGHFPYDDEMERLLPLLDRVMFDLKIVDPHRHEQATGRDNHLIRENLTRLRAAGAPLEVRMPLVPGYTADAENLAGAAAWLRRLGIDTLTFLPYYPAAGEKWRRLGKKPPPGVPEAPLPLGEERKWREFFQACMRRPEPMLA